MSSKDAAHYIEVFLRKQGFDERYATYDGKCVRKDGHGFLHTLEEKMTPCNARVLLQRICTLLAEDAWGRAENGFVWTEVDSAEVMNLLDGDVCTNKADVTT